jgi:glycosyltransferase involved in cell wall biosynthesis
MSEFLLVIPCFNEGKRFPIHYWKDLISSHPNIFWLFIDDGSTDNTFELLLNLSHLFGNCKTISLPQNIGKGNAIREGFIFGLKEIGHYKYAAYLDCDGAFDRHNVSNFLTNYEVELEFNPRKYDLIIGSRIAMAGYEIQRDFFRHLISRILITIVCWGWDKAPYDTQSGFKIFKASDLFFTSIKDEFVTRWFFDIELMLRLINRSNGDFRMKEIPVVRWKDIRGSHINAKNFPTVFLEIIRIRRLVRKGV